MTNIHRCLIVPAQHQQLAQSICAALAGPAGAGMFAVEATHTESGAIFYASSGAIDLEFAALIDDANLLFAACQQAAVPVTLAQCQSLLADSDASDEPWLAAFARLGLIKKES